MKLIKPVVEFERKLEDKVFATQNSGIDTKRTISECVKVRNHRWYELKEDGKHQWSSTFKYPCHLRGETNCIL